MYEELITIIEEQINRLTKEQISEFMYIKVSLKLKKADLLEQLKDYLKDNELQQHRLYKEYKCEFALFPNDVEKILNCTKTERLKWTQEGKLEVVKVEPFRAYGKILECPYYDRLLILSLTEDTLRNWREENKQKNKKSHQYAIKKGKDTKKIRDELRDDFKEEFKKNLASWYRVDELLGTTFEFSFWTVWVSHSL